MIHQVASGTLIIPHPRAWIYKARTMHVIMLRNTNKTDKTNSGSKWNKTKKNCKLGFRPVERSPRPFDRPMCRSKVKHELSTALKGSSIWVSGSRPVERSPKAFDRPTGQSKGAWPLSTALRGKSLVTRNLQHGRKVSKSFCPLNRPVESPLGPFDRTAAI